MFGTAIPKQTALTAGLSVLALASILLAVVRYSGSDAAAGPSAVSFGLSSEYVAYTTVQTLNYEYRNTSALPQEHGFPELRTQTIARLDAHGEVVAYRAWTSLPSGDLYQQQEYKDGQQSVNWYAGRLGGLPCTESFAWRPSGPLLPLVDATALAERGFVVTSADEGLVRYSSSSSRVPDSRIQSVHILLEVDADSGQLLSELHDGATSGSGQVTLEAWRYTRIEPADPAQFEALSAPQLDTCKAREATR